MKVIICSLLFAFGVFFINIQLSSQVNNVAGFDNPNHQSSSPSTLNTRHLPVQRAGTIIPLRNGNLSYTALGTGPITILYNSATNITQVHEGDSMLELSANSRNAHQSSRWRNLMGRVVPTLSTHELGFHNANTVRRRYLPIQRAGTVISLQNGQSYTAHGTGPITILYNCATNITHVREGDHVLELSPN